MEASRRKRRTLLLFLLLAAATSSFPPISSSPFPPDFCTSRLSSSAAAAVSARHLCPSPPTYAHLDLPTLLGSYYEVGSTARYKIKHELGMACSRLTFSATATNADGGGGDDDDSGGSDADTASDGGDQPAGSHVNFLSTGVPVVFGRQTLEAVVRIASAASNVCVTAERMCAISMPQSRTAEALLRISAVSDQFQGPAAPGVEAEALAQAAGVVNASVAEVQACLDRLARSVSVVATMNAGLSQNAGADLLLRAVRASAEEGMEQARRVGSFVISNLTYASDLVDMAASRMIVSGEATGDAARLLQEASALLQAEVQHISTQVTNIQGLLSSVGGPLADMVAAEGRTEAAVGSSAAAAGNTSRVVLRSGQAIQDPAEHGSLVLHEEAAAAETAADTPFRVLAVVPPDGSEYAAVLVQTCDESTSLLGGVPAQSELLILSRTRSLTPETVISLLGAAASNGLFADCDSPFVPTLQADGSCSDDPS